MQILPPIEWDTDTTSVVLNPLTKMYFVTENGSLLRCFTNPDMIVNEE